MGGRLGFIKSLIKGDEIKMDSRIEEILKEKVGDDYKEVPLMSRIEVLLDRLSAGGGEGGTSNYNQLSNKPSINGVELHGNKSLSDLGASPTVIGEALIFN